MTTLRTPSLWLLIATLIASGALFALVQPDLDARAECGKSSVPVEENRQPTRKERAPQPNPISVRPVDAAAYEGVHDVRATTDSFLAGFYETLRNSSWIDRDTSSDGLLSGSDADLCVTRPYPPSDRPLLV